MVTGLYAGILALMLVVLIIRVVRKRIKYQVGLGDGGIADLGQAIRIHGNFIETVPILLTILFLMEIMQVKPWLLHGYGILIVISRILHAIGVTASPLRSKGRTYGIAINLLLLVTGAVLLILMYISASLGY